MFSFFATIHFKFAFYLVIKKLFEVRGATPSKTTLLYGEFGAWVLLGTARDVVIMERYKKQY